jgi:hypothetical protein
MLASAWMSHRLHQDRRERDRHNFIKVYFEFFNKAQDFKVRFLLLCFFLFSFFSNYFHLLFLSAPQTPTLATIDMFNFALHLTSWTGHVAAYRNILAAMKSRSVRLYPLSLFLCLWFLLFSYCFSFLDATDEHHMQLHD